MKIEHSVNNIELLQKFDELVRRAGKFAPEVPMQMEKIIRPALIAAAPYDGNARHKDKHLKEVISASTVHKHKNESFITIWLNPRGVRNVKKSATAKRNWDKDKHIYKLVVAEFGRSDMPARPFWSITVKNKADKALSAGINHLKMRLDV